MDTLATVSFKFPHPAPFNGARDGFSALQFLQRLDFFFVGAGIDDSRKTVTAISFSGTDAIQWWVLQGLPPTTTFEEFKDLFPAEFSPANFKEHVLALLMKLKMNSPPNHANVMTYINEARKYFLLLQSYYQAAERNALNDAVRTAFLEGLPLQLRQMIEVTIINSGTAQFTMAQVFKSTEEFGRIFHGNSTTHGAKALAISGSSAGLSNPDAMEIDNIGTLTMATLLNTINNLSIQLNNLSRNNNSNQPPRLGKLTPAKKLELIASNGCFRCQKHHAGHIASNCAPSSGRSVNHVSFANEGGSHSGNASGN